MSFNKQKHALRATREKQSITRAKMATQVAEVMKDFIEVRPRRRCHPGARPTPSLPHRR